MFFYLRNKYLSKKYSSDFIYGSVDGVITTFAITAGFLGANAAINLIIVIGIASLLADGFSMSVSSFLSQQTANAQTKSFNKQPTIVAVVTFLAFVIIGILPIFFFILSNVYLENSNYIFALTGLGTLIILFFIGIFEAYITNKKYIKMSVQVALLGGVAAFIAYSTGNILEKLIG